MAAENKNDTDMEIIQGKIESAFLDVSWSTNLKGLIQFWAPDDCEGFLLTSHHQPFVASELADSNLIYKYRSFSHRYGYSINDNINFNQEGLGASHIQDMIIINGGSVANVFVTHMPEIVFLDLKRGENNQLVHHALECELTASLLLPVFYNYSCHKTATRCVGVIECSTNTKSGSSHLVLFFNELKKALETVGLTTFHVQDCHPYKTIPTLKLVRDEIEEALEILCESHNLTLAQVWIPYQIENRGASSSLVDTQTKRMVAVKLIGHHHVALDDGSVKEYHDTCDIFPLRMGEGLVGKALQTSETQLCRNIGELSDDGLLALLLRSRYKCSCLTVCLRSNHTGDLDYGLEFLWSRSRNYHILLESLLSTLKRCLPSFTCAVGAKLGDKLCVLDANNTNGSLIRCTPIPLHQEDVKQQSGTTMTEAASNHYEWQGRSLLKRKFSDLCSGDPDSSEEASSASSSSRNSGESPNKDTVIFKAKCRDDVMAFHLPVSSVTFVALKKLIDESFGINESFRIQYFGDTNKWVLLKDDRDLKLCLLRRNVNKSSTHIRLLLVRSYFAANGKWDIL